MQDHSACCYPRVFYVLGPCNAERIKGGLSWWSQKVWQARPHPVQVPKKRTQQPSNSPDLSPYNALALATISACSLHPRPAYPTPFCRGCCYLHLMWGHKQPTAVCLLCCLADRWEVERADWIARRVHI